MHQTPWCSLSSPRISLFLSFKFLPPASHCRSHRATLCVSWESLKRSRGSIHKMITCAYYLFLPLDFKFYGDKGYVLIILHRDQCRTWPGGGNRYVCHSPGPQWCSGHKHWMDLFYFIVHAIQPSSLSPQSNSQCNVILPVSLVIFLNSWLENKKSPSRWLLSR